METISQAKADASVNHQVEPPVVSGFAIQLISYVRIK